MSKTKHTNHIRLSMNNTCNTRIQKTVSTKTNKQQLSSQKSEQQKGQTILVPPGMPIADGGNGFEHKIQSSNIQQ